jgi:CheY-like chemotaxis protein
MDDFGEPAQVSLSTPSAVILQRLLFSPEGCFPADALCFSPASKPPFSRTAVRVKDKGERMEASSAVDSVAPLSDAPLRGPGSPVRILLADDHETVRRGVRVILAARKEYSLVEVANGEEAIAAARNEAPDLVILDLTMPSLDGFTAAQEIRKFLPHVPILFFSMHQHSPALLALAKARNVQGFVCKAESGGVLLKAVEALLAKNEFFPAESS